MLRIAFLLIFFIISNPSHARDIGQNAAAIFGTESSENFSYYNNNYIIGGDDDLKLQFSFKYRLAKSWNIYFAYTQLMFWKIYDESKPFAGINYNPEVFYRLFEGWRDSFFNLDMGYIHTSNGEDDIKSRSLDRIFLRHSFGAKIERNYVGIQLMAHYIYNEDDTNKDIIDHLGYYSLGFFVSDLVLIDDNHLDLEIRLSAGKKLYDFDQGSYQFGLVYKFGWSEINPSVYLQRFEGFSEHIGNYDKKRTEYRIGLLLSY